MYQSPALTYLSVLMIFLLSMPVKADDSPIDACNNAAKLFADDDLDGALEEAKWCVTLLEQTQQARISQFFKDSILGYRGGELESQSLLGFSTTQREYQKNDKSINVTLSGSVSVNGIDAFSALSQLGMSSGAGKKLRIQKRSAVIISEDSHVQILLTMKKGGTLVFESNSASVDDVQEFAEAFPIEELDDSRG